jgi:hypothetical protein
MSATTDTTYTLCGTTSLPFVDAVARVRETLKEQGFGVWVPEIQIQSGRRSRTAGGRQLRTYARHDPVWYTRACVTGEKRPRNEWASRRRGYAARRYSRISPPSRSRRRTRSRSMTLAIPSSPG